MPSIEIVEDIYQQCRIKKSELNTGDAIHVDGLQANFRVSEKRVQHVVHVKDLHSQFIFHRKRLEACREKIEGQLLDLPKGFYHNVDKGASFMLGMINFKGEYWGDRNMVEKLFAIGIAIGLVELPIPREKWSELMGGCPYFCIKLDWKV